jgi:CubicO group peptidase (beta-lactamase class C family)
MLSTESISSVPGVDARSLGFDPERLRRIDRYLQRYVDDGLLPGWELAITRRDEIAHLSRYGERDIEAGLPVTGETLWRIYSMTKPIASVAAMSLWEEGAFGLNDPISDWLPAFADARVYVKGSISDAVTVPATEPIRVWHLLSHTSGITAGWMSTSVVDALYRAAGFGTTLPPGTTLTSFTDAMARLPLLFEPGSAWGYGNSTDVLGRLIEIWSGQRLDVAIAERVTTPLGMPNTVWQAHEQHDLATLYGTSDGEIVRLSELSEYAKQAPGMLGAGAGMLSTLPDYMRFTRMLAGRGTVDNVQILAPRTLQLMARNHLSSDLAELCTGGFTNLTLDGVGFGLGFGVMVDPIKSRSVSSPGEYYWGGAASTIFWVDPVERLTVVFMTQLMHFERGELVPSEALPLRDALRRLVYSAILD